MSAPQRNAARPLVLIVSASVGVGHNQAARALTDALRAEAPELDVEWLDVLDFTPWPFRAYYAGGYAFAVTKAPVGYGIGFWLNNRPNGPRRGLFERRRLWTERWAMRRFTEHLHRKQPALIVSTHLLPPPLIGRMIATGRLNVPQMVVVTDDEIHRFWYAENVERWFIPAEFGRDKLMRWGIDPARITVSGMPVHPKWVQPLDRERVLSQWNLPADRKIVVVTGGAAFICGPIAAIARRVARACDDAYVVVLAGRNKELLARLARMPECPDRLVGVSFTDRVHELVHAASLVITKAGGSTTAECLAKGTPMVLMKPVPGHEAGNARYFAREGVAVLTRSPRHTVAETCRLLADEAALAQLAENARRLYRPATQTLVAAIREAVGPALRAGGQS